MMKAAEDLLPWKVTDISFRPYDGMWSMNPSIHFDGEVWRCILRCCDYAMPGGVTIRSKNARPVGQQTKNAMILFDPKTWQPVKIFKIHEKDGLPRAVTPHFGYEDMRIFKTDKGGLQGIAAALHLSRDHRVIDGMPQHQPPEQVLLSFDTNYDIIHAHPIRGDGWSGTPQKNWVPFNHCAEPRFLYSIDKGTMFDDRGTVHGAAAQVKPSIKHSNSLLNLEPCVAAERLTSPVAEVPKAGPPTHNTQVKDPRPPDRRAPMLRSGDMRIVRGGRVALDTLSSRPSSHPSSRPITPSKLASHHGTVDSTRMVNSGHARVPKYDGLRGGTQLSRVGDDAWLGIGHQMKFVNGKKYYWHVLYLVNSRGKMTAASEPLKLAPNGIEFAAGLAIDGDRAVISFGVDDMKCRLGETSLAAVMGVLQPRA
jgi:hypothetical protein